MADCGNGSVGTCLSSLFIMKHNCLENLSCNVYSNESNNLSNTKCMPIDDKAYFSSLRELDGVLDKDLNHTSDSAICSLDSPSEDSEDFKKKRCMDRYDSSESSDSGVLTGSTCSESSSNSGNSDITDPCSPYSVTFFHLGDDNGSPLALPSKSSSYPNSDLLTDSKMLPENINREEENDVSCWAWDYLYEKVFQQERVANPLTVYEKHVTEESAIFREKPQENENESSDTTAIKSDDDDATTNKCFSNSSYPLDFFNILPSVFEGPILYSACDDVDDDNGSELLAGKTRTIVSDHNTSSDQEHPHTVLTARHTRSDTLFCRTNSLKNISDDTAAYNHNNNIINKNENDILKKSSVCSSKSQDADLASTEVNSLPNILETVTSSRCREQTRFPSERKSSFFSERICRWADCVDHVSSSAKLIEHLQTKHVNPQTFSGTFICLWNGCKVFGRPSCSRTFLERHVLSHGGNKPYRCIVDNCGQRFSSQLMLERHVNQHFKTPKEISDGFVDTTPKLIRRNGQKLRYRRQPYSVRNRADAFDASIMSHLQYLLVQMARRSNTVSLNVMDSKQFLYITFQPKVIGCRQEKDGQTKYLIRWYPYNSLEDEWLSKSDAEKNKTLPIWELPASVQQMFWNSIFPKQTPAVRQPRKYKKPESNMIDKTVITI